MAAANSTKAYIPGLDGIRALAVLTIFIFHAEILPHVPGELATTVFFFLSGFLITTLFVKEFRKTGDIHLGAFYYRRVLRLLPPLYLVLAIALTAAYFLNIAGPLVPWKTFGNFFQYTNYALAFSGSEAGFLPGMVLLWSLAVDEHYYLLYAPLLRRALPKWDHKQIISCILGLCALMLLWRCWLVHVGGVEFRVTMATDTRLDSILWGALLALWRNPALDPAVARSLAKPLPLLVGVLLVVLPSLSGKEAVKATIGYTLEGIGLMPIFAAAIIHHQRFPMRVLQSRLLYWVSQISYPLYLFQWLVLTACSRYLHSGRLMQVAAAFAITIALATLLHVAVERPLARLRRKSHRQAVAESRPEQLPLAS
jgi:peptidoglycan/LPS O-acetylase OafA/YrhL